MSAETQLTPMMAQYRRIKGELPKDALLLFRLGDFYEMFFEDAQVGAQLLNVALTRRGVIPMCGIPYHAANGYIARILKAGRKVAICDQMEDARPGQLVKREVTQILSPGTHFDERMLAADRNNFLAAVCAVGKTLGLALVELTTGNFKSTEAEGDAALLAELERLRPAEVIFPGESAALHETLRRTSAIVLPYDDWTFAPETAGFTLREHFKVASLDGFGLKGRTAAIGAAGAVLHYLTQHLRRDCQHLTSLQFYQPADFLLLDATTLRHLEILEPLHRDAPRNACLYGAVQRPVTPMGARRLRDWLSQPLANADDIARRQDAVEAFLTHSEASQHFRNQLAEVRDLERTIGRLSVGSGNARDLVALRQALEQLPVLLGALASVGTPAAPEFLSNSKSTPLREGVSADDPGPIEPTGQGVFGPVFGQLRGRAKAAIAQLLKVQTGEVPGAISHPDVGEIDLVWGSAGPTPRRGYGLAKILAVHPEIIGCLHDLLAQLRKSEETSNSIHLDSDTHHAVVRTNWNGTEKRWLLTAFEKKGPSMAGRTMDISNPPAGPEPTGMTKLPPSHGGQGQPLAEEPTPVKPRTPTRDEGELPLLVELSGQITTLPALVELIARAIAVEPPLALKEGGLIRDGFSVELDELRSASRGGKDWIAQLQQREIEHTGIASLKVRFNSVFGYFIEVTKANLDKVPAHYTRKQTVANGERYITPELKEMESKILGAEERSVKLEYDLFLKVREEALQSLQPIQSTADALAQLDVLAAFAETARLHNYTRPRVSDEGVLRIRDGRHPVLEQTLVESRFVPNDTALAGCAPLSPPSPPSGERAGVRGQAPPSPPSGERAGVRGQAANATELSPANAVTSHPSPLHSESEREQIRAASECGAPQIVLITGPNMAGKSTYIRQVALLTLLAHTGSFIPAAEARIDLVDRIFTRIGASDDLARGQSTFMVEMSETANILHNATSRSLIILDEIGRGTSTFDGLSLAWGIVEYLHNQIGAKTLFATHYHELTELARRLPRLKNLNVAVREWNDQVVFLHKIVEGGADKSYGIQVARLAGVPKTVVERAKEILRNLEESELTPEGAVRQTPRRQRDREKLQQLAPVPQMDLFAGR